MEVGAEAKRIMVVALGKLYSSRTQRGGLRLHRSLLLTLVMKSARDMYHAAAQTDDAYYGGGGDVVPDCGDPAQTDPPPASDSQHQQHHDSSSAPQTVPGPERHTPPGDAVTQPVENTLTCSQTQQSRKRRGKTSAVPDFLPLKKAKLDFQTQLVVLVDYVTCSDLGAVPSPIPVPMAIAAC